MVVWSIHPSRRFNAPVASQGHHRANRIPGQLPKGTSLLRHWAASSHVTLPYESSHRVVTTLLHLYSLVVRQEQTLNCGIENSDCGTGPPIVSGGCPGMYAAGWEILTSFTSLDHVSNPPPCQQPHHLNFCCQVMNNLATSFETVLTALNIAQATNDFFPSQTSVFADQEILSAVAGILGLIGGLVGLGEETALMVP